MDLNEKFNELLGYSKDEIVGKNHNLFIPYHLIKSKKYIEFWDNLRNGFSQIGSFKKVTKNENEIWTQCAYIPVINSDKKVERVFEIIKNINEEKQRISDLEQQISAFTKSNLIMEFDLEGNIISLNDNYLNLLEYSKDEIIGKNYFIILPMIRRKELSYNDFWNKLKHGQFQIGEFEFVSKNGNKFYACGTFNPIMSLNGCFYKIIFSGINVTENKELNLNNREIYNAINRSISYVEFDLEGKITKVNDNFLKLMKYTSTEIIGENHSIFLTEEEISLGSSEFWNKLRDGNYINGDYKRVNKFGKIIWLKSGYNPIFDIEGKPYKIIKYSLDITKSKEAEEKIKRAEEQLFDFVNNASIGLNWLDYSGNFLWANKYELEVLGYSEKELIGKNISEIIEDKSISKFLIEKFSTNGFVNDFEVKVKAKNGLLKDLSITSRPYFHENKFVHTRCFIRDITQENLLKNENMKKESELLSSDNNLKIANLAILNQKKALDSSAIVAETDATGRIIYVNDKFIQISKYNKEDIIGHDHRILNSGFHDKSFFIDLWKTISKGEIWHGEIKNKAKDGTYYWVDTTIYPLKNEKNKPIGYIAIRFDITDKKEAFEILKCSKEKALLAERNKSEFLYTMSHEIRTPLNGIIGMISLLQETKLTLEQNEYSEVILHSGKTLLTIINDILDFSKIESGKMFLDEIEFDLILYINNLLKNFQFMAKKKNIIFNVVLPKHDYMVYGDEGKIGQILLNLVSNAIKFTEKGSVLIEFNVQVKEIDTVVHFIVKDTGHGIPDAEKKNIFNAFTQAEKSTSRKFGGTGLGLSISKRLVDLMNGEINFESEYGKGTTFNVTLNLKTGRKISAVIGKDENIKNKLSAKILIAEDNLTNQIVISRILEKLGHDYHVVNNGKEVLKILNDYKFDLILMDCQMPEMDGYQAAELIRKNTKYNVIPIVALTANVVKGDDKKCLAAGMNDYITKPITKNKIEEVINKYLSNSIRDH